MLDWNGNGRIATPHPSVVVREDLVDGTEVEAVWAWLPESEIAKYFRE